MTSKEADLDSRLEMTEITGAELFARALQEEGIEFLFGLPSPEVDPLLAQLEAHGIRLVPVRHEAAGVHMAEGLYKRQPPFPPHRIPRRTTTATQPSPELI
jgi:Thiamine pyrophosphate enzyme, N-terminal TPP binding domain